MKKAIAFVLAAVMLLSVFCVAAAAEVYVNEEVRIIMSTDEVKVSNISSSMAITSEELKSALEDGADKIPEGTKIDPERVTVMGQKWLDCELEEYYATFKVWSGNERTLCLLFKQDGAESWELMSCNLGPIVEGHFYGNGVFAVLVTW